MKKSYLIIILTFIFTCSHAFSLQAIEELSEYHCTIFERSNTGGHSNFGSYCPIVGAVAFPLHYPRSHYRVLNAYVIVSATVTNTGTTTNVTVLNSYYEYANIRRSSDGIESEVIKVVSPVRGFDRSAVKAVLKFKFKPLVKDGKSAAINNVIFKLDYVP